MKSIKIKNWLLGRRVRLLFNKPFRSVEIHGHPIQCRDTLALPSGRITWAQRPSLVAVSKLQEAKVRINSSDGSEGLDIGSTNCWLNELFDFSPRVVPVELVQPERLRESYARGTLLRPITNKDLQVELGTRSLLQCSS